ncbi:hypothetical protein L1987_55611 [Smallanthus sonchifolius]|uniref:Uncharacterized protein n=1 Tax=Smallanthus sonchifolius TaxID=185202 RepID=A0ACB9EAD9_9ASTR|nr:hypothetical protein L1987_55611 [Smallanthus sonchifolius]
MDSRMRLDYALFQLTPTRTRCDLIICAGDCKEKLASGLLEPFVSHLKFAKDEISKGGYSITLSAPASASWFTKSTLERFVSLDEHLKKSAAFAYKHEDNTSDSLHEEDSKLHLQRVLETRKAVLQREQAMVYARALVAGFETDFLQDLVCFADAFGSPRLREACLDFMELCITKSDDRVWMDEVVAMQAYSGSQYAYMEDDLAQELRINVQNVNLATKKLNGSVDGISNESHLPQYIHSYQGGPMFHPPYQGYPFPYYQGNLPWPPNVEGSRGRGRRSHKKRSQKLTKDSNFDSSDSSSGSDSGSYKRSSSKKVIIRNINYITSARDEESKRKSDADQNLDRTVEEKHEGQKVTQQWDIFQNLLLKDVDDKESMEEYVSHKFEDPNIIPSRSQSKFTTISSSIGKHEEKDWYLRSRPDKEFQERSRDIFEDHIKFKTHDGLMVLESNLTRKKVEDTCISEPNDLHMVLERDAAGQEAVPAWTPEMESGNSSSKIVKMDSPEVNKSKAKALVKGLERKGSTFEAKSKALAGSRRKTPAATTTTIPKGRSEKEEQKRKKMEELLTERQKRIAERAKNDKPRAQLTTKNDKPRAQLTTKNDKPKAQQTAKNDKPKAQQTPNDATPKAQSRYMKSSNRTIIRSSTIDRLSAARVVNPKVLSTKPKPGNKPMKPPTKKNDKNMVSKNSNGPKKKIVDHNKSKQLPKASQIKKIGNGVAHIGLSTPAYSDNTKSVSETLQKTSSVLQKDITISDSNVGSTTKAVNSVSFKINEDNSGAKKIHIAKVNHEVPIMETLTPLPAKAIPEISSSRKKWSSLETSSKALSGFKKLLSFGRRS